MSVTARTEALPELSRPARVWSGAGRIDTGDDVDRVLAAVTAAGQRRDRTSGLIRVVDRAKGVALSEPDGARVLPVAAELSDLLSLNWPGGVRRGATVAVTGSNSLLLALLAGPMAQGSWAAVVGVPDLGAAAAVEYGIDLSRLVLVPDPGDRWAEAVAALVDGLDIVAVATPGEVPARLARSLMARARQRGCVLVSTRSWPGCDMTLRLVERRWLGLGHGRGRLRLQNVTVEASGRGRAERPRRADLTLPLQSTTKRVGSGWEPSSGLLVESARDPDRVHESIVMPERLRPAPAVDPWREMFRPIAEDRTEERRAG